MKFIPNYTVKYGGEYLSTGKEYEVPTEAATELSGHGTIVEDSTPPPAPEKRRKRNGQSGTAKGKNAGS